MVVKYFNLLIKLHNINFLDRSNSRRKVFNKFTADLKISWSTKIFVNTLDWKSNVIIISNIVDKDDFYGLKLNEIQFRFLDGLLAVDLNIVDFRYSAIYRVQLFIFMKSIPISGHLNHCNLIFCLHLSEKFVMRSFVFFLSSFFE